MRTHNTNFIKLSQKEYDTNHKYKIIILAIPSFGE